MRITVKGYSRRLSPGSGSPMTLSVLLVDTSIMSIPAVVDDIDTTVGGPHGRASSTPCA
jgi:hypothetical protein